MSINRVGQIELKQKDISVKVNIVKQNVHVLQNDRGSNVRLGDLRELGAKEGVARDPEDNK